MRMSLEHCVGNMIWNSMSGIVGINLFVAFSDGEFMLVP